MELYFFLLRAIGNSITPLFFLGVATIINIMLDIIFVVVLKQGVGGVAFAYSCTISNANIC